jgi:hypothetical protein
VPSRAPVEFAAFVFAAPLCVAPAFVVVVAFALPAFVVIVCSPQPAQAAAQASNTNRDKIRRIKITSRPI